jgi:phosphoribosylformimino-5-aminoimidazole carboxamide ribotide isomerase
MHIIPVGDLLHGTVVRAVRGERQHYRPIESALCGSAEPTAVAARLCEHCATDTLYLADLDALQGGAVQLDALAALLRARPALRLWLDAGFMGPVELQAALDGLAGRGTDASRVTPVLASESWRSLDGLREALRARPQPLLSLDRRGEAALDAAGAWSAPECWPQRLIVMSLDRVGSAEGPDLQALAAVRTRAPRATLIGAGGIRHGDDLRAAEAAGASAWLVASALHDGTLNPAGLRAAGTVCPGGGNDAAGAATLCDDGPI